MKQQLSNLFRRPALESAWLLFTVCALVGPFSNYAAQAATVVTDQQDYAPGTTAYITGSGFEAGETVQFQVLHADGTPDTGEDHEPWLVTDGGAGDLDGVVDGNVLTTWHVCEDDCVGATLELTATGLTSGSVATTQFTDANDVTVTPATGGGAISADTAGGTYTALTGPVLQENGSGAIGTGTIILNAPSGFIFDTSATVTVLLNGGATAGHNINNLATGSTITATVTATTITITITSKSNSGDACKLTWQNVRVRPTTCTPLASGNITKTGTSGYTTNPSTTNYGTLTEVAGSPPMIICPTDAQLQCGASTDPSNTGTATAAGGCGTVTITHTDATTAANCTGKTGIDRTWKATDGTGAFSTCVQHITFVDTTAPMITGVPAETTVECSAVPAGAATLPASDNCDTSVTTATLNTDQIAPGTCAGRYTITRTWTATDACGNTKTATQTIHVVDTTAPMITGVPAETTVECSAVPAGAATLPASDNCDTSVTAATLNADVITPGTCAGRYTITRSWTATDACGNTKTATQTIHVVDTTAPMITGVPAETTVECSAVPAGAATLPASDNCDTSVTTATLNTDQIAPGTCAGRYTITRTWTATDACGNTKTATQTIHVVDTTAPMITGVPAETTVECSAVPAGAATLPASDNCDTSVTTATLNTDQIAPGTCAGRYTITRTWTATDACGNTKTATQTIHVVDTTAPMITGVPAETTVECSAVPAGAATLPASDNCDTSVTAATLNADVITPGTCAGRYTITRSWTATDACGNTKTATQTIHVVDTTAPMITGVPAETTVECSAVPAGAATLPASDNCDTSVTTATLNTDQIAPGTCAGRYTITRTWTATDACGNTKTATQTIHVVDTTAPMITGVPAETTVECSAVPAGAATLPASDNCDTSVTAATLNADVITPGTCAGRYTITRSWTATDACGNTKTATQTIHVVDTTAPMITGVPAETTVECSAVPAGAATLPASDNCDTSVTTATLNTDQIAPGTCAGRYTITRTWTATDACGNTKTATQTIHVVDTTAPMITGVPAETTVECSAVPAGAATLPASDNCDTSVTTATLNTDQIAPGTCAGRYTITRTWTATDACGNTKTATQTIHVVDTTAPMITGVPAETTVECSAVPAGAATLPASDNCDTSVTAATLNADQIAPGTCAGRYTITRTWTATDACGNTKTATQTIHVVDTTAPMITGVPAETTVECSAVPAGAATLPASDNCDTSVTTATLNTDQIAPGTCAGRYTITRTWTATDACGNTKTATQTIHVVDTTAPMITGVPAETTVECSAVPAGAATLPASDNCDTSVTAATLNADVITPGTCAGRYTITRSWTATDACGNSKTESQTIHVMDTNAPVIACPPDKQLQCGDSTATNNTGLATSTGDNCGGAVTITYTDATTPTNCTGKAGIDRTWKATDACGNMATCVQHITFVDMTAPMIGAVTGPSVPLSINSLVAITNNFTDSCPQTHTVTFIWDDLTPNTSVNVGAGSTVAWTNHTYNAAGVYTIGVIVTDACGNSQTNLAAFEFVVIYDPSGGFVTGGGWINSPSGAYVGTTLVGKANFGFVSKYQKGATIPTGETEFQFQVGNLNFHSTSYQWLVISGAKAQYKGFGTINNGATNYGFLLTATDGQVNGGGNVDKFRIKIWDIATALVVYDNVPLASDDIDTANPQIIGGGSIVLHK